MNKTYQPLLPTSNRILQKKWDEKNYAEHRNLVRDARASIDTRPPKTFMHLHMKLKKLQLEEERIATIERDNRILLEKMSHIMQTTGSVDNRNKYEPKSLNHEKRRRELLRVSKENATLVKKIMEYKPESTRDNSKANWSKNSVYSDQVSKYDSDSHKSNNLENKNGKPSSKRSESTPRDNKEGVKTLAATKETETTDKGNNETQQ